MAFAFIAGIVAVIAVIGGLLTLVQSSANRHHSERAQRLRVLEDALKQPGIDDETRRRIVASITDEAAQPQLWARLSFGIGWVMFIVSGGFILLHMLEVIRYLDYDVVIGGALLGLAMLSLPLGMREFARRSVADES